jgi:hypothetical protein
MTLRPSSLYHQADPALSASAAVLTRKTPAGPLNLVSTALLSCGGSVPSHPGHGPAAVSEAVLSTIVAMERNFMSMDYVGGLEWMVGMVLGDRRRGFEGDRSEDVMIRYQEIDFELKSGRRQRIM